jgi:hypothetical protein
MAAMIWKCTMVALGRLPASNVSGRRREVAKELRPTGEVRSLLGREAFLLSAALEAACDR